MKKVSKYFLLIVFALVLGYTFQSCANRNSYGCPERIDATPVAVSTIRH